MVGRDPLPDAAANDPVRDRLEVIIADAREPETAVRAIDRCVERFGGFHGLYHVAGGSGRAWGDGPLHTIPLSGWQQTLDLNLTTAFLSNRAAIHWFLREKQAGCILNCGSVLANSPSPELFGTMAYATAKSALVGMTQASAAAYAPHNIRVNLVAPGLTATPCPSGLKPTPRSRISSPANNRWTVGAWDALTTWMRRSSGCFRKAADSSPDKSSPSTAVGRSQRRSLQLRPTDHRLLPFYHHHEHRIRNRAIFSGN